MGPSPELGPVRAAVEPAGRSDAVLWLCPDEARYVTGRAVRVDAGASLR